MSKGGGGGRKASGGSKGLRIAGKIADAAIAEMTRKPYSTKRLSAAANYLQIKKTTRGKITWTSVSMASNTPKYLRAPKSASARERYYRQIATQKGESLPKVLLGRFK